MKNYLTEKLLLDTKFGSNCTLEVCTAGEPDADVSLMSGTVSDCLRKIMSHALASSGDEYFCLYTDLDSYCGIDLDEISWRMGMDPEYLRDVLERKPSLSDQIGSAAQILKAEGHSPEKAGVPDHNAPSAISYLPSIRLCDSK